uniref:Uncharacterized protein n=1 Tax=Chrysotila carterae TaxID=13221 RepID=A0A7S4C1N4_CHRCT
MRMRTALRVDPLCRCQCAREYGTEQADTGVHAAHAAASLSLQELLRRMQGVTVAKAVTSLKAPSLKLDLHCCSSGPEDVSATRDMPISCCHFQMASSLAAQSRRLLLLSHAHS